MAARQNRQQIVISVRRVLSHSLREIPASPPVAAMLGHPRTILTSAHHTIIEPETPMTVMVVSRSHLPAKKSSDTAAFLPECTGIRCLFLYATLQGITSVNTRTIHNAGR